MYTADPGNAGLGLRDRSDDDARGRMLGGSSGINYMAYVRGHPGDFDAWAGGGRTGWSYDDVLPSSRRARAWRRAATSSSTPTHTTPRAVGCVRPRAGPRGRARVRRPPPSQPASPSVTTTAATEAARPGSCRCIQTTTRSGKRSSTYHAFLEGDAEQRPNLRIITDAQVTRIVLDDDDSDATGDQGIEYRRDGRDRGRSPPPRKSIVCAGAIGSPHLLMLSGIGPRDELEAAGVRCRLDAPGVGKHLQDHLHTPLMFDAPGVGVSMAELGLSLGPDALRSPAGPLPVDPADDANLPPELQALKAEAERRLTEWATTGHGLAASSMFEATVFFSTGLGDEHTHDAQSGSSPAATTPTSGTRCCASSRPSSSPIPTTQLGPEATSIIVLSMLVQPHSEGEIRLVSNDPDVHPDIHMNYYDDPHDLAVMVAAMRRSLDIVAHWPANHNIGPALIPPALAQRHGHTPGDPLSDELLEDFARHYSMTVYHPTSTCRIGTVVDPDLRVRGITNLRVADASVMPTIVSGNTNAACIMIGEKAAELIAVDHAIALHNHTHQSARSTSFTSAAAALRFGRSLERSVNND